MIIAKRFEELGVVPVVTLQNPSEAEPLGEALIEGGLPCAEITLRTDAAVESIRRLSARRELLIGAGTVLSIEQAEKAQAAGARFLVSPGLNPRVVKWALAQHIPIFPGVSSATEIEQALDLGLTHLKFFPAEPLGGIPLIKALSQPYPMVRFMPTGGINLENLEQYLSHSSVFACGGSWMAKSDWIRKRDFSEIRKETGNTVHTINSIRSGDEVKDRR